MRDLIAVRQILNTYTFCRATITGTGDGLLMNQYRVESQLEAQKQTLKKKVYSPEEDAKKSAYMAEIDGQMQLYIPALCVYTMMVQACSGKKLKNPNGGRAIAAKGIMAGNMKVTPDKIPLGTDKYEIDIRRAVIGKAAVPRARAWLPKWTAVFNINYDSSVIHDPSIFLEILDEAGVKLGLLDYRPQHMGPFGTFTVSKFEV